MVLWEITLGTAYFLGLKRTYRLALRIQRRVISPKHPRIRQFVHRLMGQLSIGLLADESQIGNGHFEVYLLIKLESKEDYDDNDDGGGGVDNDMYDTDMVRAAFDIALKFHRNIQQRDIEVGRNVGNWILRWLDRMKPSAQIHGPPEKLPHGPSMNMTNHGMKSSNPKTPGVQTSRNKESDLHLFSSSKNIWPKLPFSTIAMMMRHPRPAGTITQYRHLQTNGSDQLSLNYNRNGFDGVLRKDIRQWLLQM
ncbi:hypothetical protein KPL71_015071 [Citrus sinensis]|uniref:Uncharacterized protein n=1 Tax=Citrus sinensis TaxID=2711 RepID=A0ACB8KGJ5_CITSI|nr:hypothetical protein KPL71_015071 [Citrus sinensis]